MNEGADLYVKVDAAYPDGVSQVRLYKNGVKLVRNEDSAPYEWAGPGQTDPELQNLKQGTFILTAQATDSLGNIGQTVVEIKVTVGGARAEYRNGIGVNPSILFSPDLPVLGTTWHAAIDGGSIGASGLTFLVACFDPCDPGLLLSCGELLLDPSSPLIVASISGNASGLSMHEIAIPSDPAFYGVSFTVQGYLNNVYGHEALTNAYDLVLGI